MSRLNTLSASAVKAMFSSETDEALIMLLTIYNTAPGDDPLRLSDSYTGRLVSLTNDEEVIYGVTSRSNEYIFLPMEVGLPGELDTGVGSCTLTLKYAGPDAVELIRTKLTEPTKVLIELVLSGSPDTVEASFPGFFITSATYNADQIVFELNMVSLSREPFPCFNFTPSYFPGLY